MSEIPETQSHVMREFSSSTAGLPLEVSAGTKPETAAPQRVEDTNNTVANTWIPLIINVFGIVLVCFIISITAEFNLLNTASTSYSKLSPEDYFAHLRIAFKIEASGANISEKQKNVDEEQKQRDFDDELRKAREIDSQIVLGVWRFAPFLALENEGPHWCVLFFQFYYGGICHTADSRAYQRLVKQFEPKTFSLNSISDQSKSPQPDRGSSSASSAEGQTAEEHANANPNAVLRAGRNPPRVEVVSEPPRRTLSGPSVTELASFAERYGLTITQPSQVLLVIMVRELIQAIVFFLSSYVLPLLYGFLGATVYLMRLYYGQGERGWSLPRQTGSLSILFHALLRIGLGGVAGLAIGWFWSPDTARMITEKEGLAAPPLALAFLAGFSIELLFSIIDRVLAAINPAGRLPLSRNLAADLSEKQQ